LKTAASLSGSDAIVDELGKALPWGTLAFGVLTCLTIAAGDPPLARVAVFGFWAAGACVAVLARRSGSPRLASHVLACAVWAAFAFSQWMRGAVADQVDPWQIMAILVGAVFGGRMLALGLCAASVANIVGLWWAKTEGLSPVAQLGRSFESMVADEIGLVFFVLLGVIGLMQRLASISASERRQSALAADSAEKFKALFLDSPTPMALVEIDRREQSAAFPPPEKRQRKGFAPKILAVNASFGSIFESGTVGSPSSPSSVAQLWRYPEDFDDVERRLHKEGVIKGSKAFMVSWRNKKKMVCLSSASMSQWEGAQAVLWTFQDVTEIELLRHRLERQNQALADKLESTALEARYDALTLLPNRRALEERVAMVDGQDRSGGLCAYMVDVDCFKKYNDSLGHQAGDTCLAKIGEALAAAASEWGERAFAARYGGEEFSMLLLNPTPKEAERAGQAICDAVSSLALAHPSNTAGPIVTVSVGASMRLRAGSTMEALKRADSALYQSKTHGRNQSRIDPPEEARG
jgi:diguanylate cyclase (GGDEF)-like protein